MVTGASTADVAVILIDARKGVLTQTRRHSYLVSLIGIRKVVLAINKMDLVDYDEAGYPPHRRASTAPSPRRSAWTTSRRSRCRACAATTSSTRSARTPWYHGPTLMAFLETGRDRRDAPAGRPVPPAGAVGQPAEPRLPRLLRH